MFGNTYTMYTVVKKNHVWFLSVSFDMNSKDKNSSRCNISSFLTIISITLLLPGQCGGRTLSPYSRDYFLFPPRFNVFDLWSFQGGTHYILPIFHCIRTFVMYWPYLVNLHVRQRWLLIYDFSFFIWFIGGLLSYSMNAIICLLKVPWLLSQDWSLMILFLHVYIYFIHWGHILGYSKNDIAGLFKAI